MLMGTSLIVNMGKGYWIVLSRDTAVALSWNSLFAPAVNCMPWWEADKVEHDATGSHLTTV